MKIIGFLLLLFGITKICSLMSLTSNNMKNINAYLNDIEKNEINILLALICIDGVVTLFGGIYLFFIC